MRSTKYHDYRILKIILFLALVIIGLFVYFKCVKPTFDHVADADAWKIIEEVSCTKDGQRCKVCTECGVEFDHETIPATGHKACDMVIENEKASTCTEGGSYDEVVYCEYCDEVLSKETVQVEIIPHNPSAEKVENKNPATHTGAGTYEGVVYCKDCGYEISRTPKIIEPTGHNYNWTLTYDEASESFTMTGSCNCNEEGNKVVYTGEDVDISLKIYEDIPTCCLKVYIGKVEHEGVVYTAEVEVETDEHMIERGTIYDQDGTPITVYVPITHYAKWDDEYGWYYDLSVPGLGYYDIESNQWDENGFALGAYKCVLCEDKACSVCNNDYWYVVQIYSPEYDTRLQNN